MFSSLQAAAHNLARCVISSASRMSGPLAVSLWKNYGKGLFIMAWRQSPGRGSFDHPDQPVPFGQQLDRARHGDAEAMSLLYRQFLPGVFGYMAFRVPDRATAEDLTSEVFLQMVEGLSRVRATEEASFAAWILQIARVTVAGYYRKREKHPLVISLSSATVGDTDSGTEALALASPDPADDPVSQFEAREEWEEVVKAINALTEEQRQVLVGRLIMGYDVETVARMLGKKTNAIKALQFRALQSLHRLLGRQAIPRRAPSSHIRNQAGIS